jgi:dTDP-4-amino-4,6-dideoxygalactose transaminase
MKIPLCKPYWDREEEKSVITAMRKTLGTGDGPNTQKLILILAKYTGVKYVIPTTSCTHGMELVLNSLDIKPGEEIIVPSFTMSSTANSIILAGGKPVFADIDPLFCNIDPIDIERKITAKTRGIMVVHYAGMPAPMKKIKMIARKHNLFIVEDAAHAIGVKYYDRMLGNWGDAGVFSFHGTKNICSGEGGVVLTNRKDIVDKMEIYRANGTNRKQFLDGIVDKYSWVGRGTSFFLSDILASILVPQMKKSNQIIKKRQEIAAKYLKALEKYSDQIILPKVPDHTIPNWHIFAIRLRNYQDRPVFIKYLRQKGIEASYHYVPLHNSPFGIKLAHGRPAHLPVTDEVGKSLVRLPIYPGLKQTEIHYIINSVCFILNQLKSTN